MSKVVKLAESELVDLIDNIVKEAVAAQLPLEKKKWIQENREKAKAILEAKIQKSK
jgi:hypothetical protein